MIFTVAVEGASDEAVLRRIAGSLGHSVDRVYGRNGKASLLRDLSGYNHAAQFTPWIVVIDLDREPCAVLAARQWLSARSSFMCFRIAIREVESWLLADRERFASYFGVSAKHVPSNSDSLPDPKEALINAVRHTRRKNIREDVVPDQRLGQSVGPAYTTRLIEFVNSSSGWRPEVAAFESPSLARAVQAIERLALLEVDQTR